MNIKQLIVLIVGVPLLVLEVLYVPIWLYHKAGSGLVIRVEGLRYEWLPNLPANAVIQSGLVTVEIVATLFVCGLLFWIFSLKEWPEWLPTFS